MQLCVYFEMYFGTIPVIIFYQYSGNGWFTLEFRQSCVVIINHKTFPVAVFNLSNHFLMNGIKN